MCAALIYCLACDRGALARALGRPWLIVLGQASYAIYLLHGPLHDWYLHLALLPTQRFPDLTTPLTGAMWLGYMALVLACSLLAWRCVERPANRWLRSGLRSGRGVSRAIGQGDRGVAPRLL